MSVADATGLKRAPSDFKTPTSIHLRVPAKVNLCVQVGSRRSDGYHDITTVFQAVSLYDELTVSESQSLSMAVTGEGAADIPCDSRNLVMKAALALAKHAGIVPLAEFRLVKRIPTESGLGGGSADAAATLVACNRLWDLRYTDKRLETIGAGIGEDVPFLIRGMMAIGTGHLEPLIPLEVDSSTFNWVLGVPNIGLATAIVYSMFDQMTEPELDMQCFQKRRSHCLSVNWGMKDSSSLATLLANDLEKAAIALLPDVKFALEAGRSAGAIASTMTGTGSTCVFLAENSAHAESIATKLGQSSIFRKVLTATGPVPGVQETSPT